MKKVSLLGMAIALAFSQMLFAAPEIESNRKLGDVMLMLSDQAGGLAELSKAVATTVEDKVINRALGRARGAQYLLGLVKEKLGTVEDGKLVFGELTPGKLLTVQGQDLLTMKAQFEKGLDDVKEIMAGIEKELGAQLAKIPAQRDFRNLKLALVKLDGEVKEEHKAFKPPEH